MSDSLGPDRRIAVIGGGISGLAAAHRIVELEPNARVRLFEASGRLGGVLETEQHDGFQIELGSDSFITNRPGAVELCQRIGLGDELIRTNDAFRKTFVVRRGRLCEVPEGFLLMAPAKIGPVLRSPILSLAGKLRLACEVLIPRRKPEIDDESLAAFVRRRLGHEVFDRLVQPLVGGIYTADAELLSLRATLPRFLDMEREHGSLIRATRRQAREQPREAARESGARYSLFVTPRRGLSSLVAALAARLPPQSIALDTPVTKIVRKPDGRWDLHLSPWRMLPASAPTLPASAPTLATSATKESSTVESFDAVIVATPAPVAARQLAEVDPELSGQLSRIPYAGAGVVSIAYDRGQIAHPLDGFGFVVPEIERRRILACSFSSVKFAGRAPAGKELFRVFVGGAKHPEIVDLSDAALLELVTEELSDLLSIHGPPLFHRISRYRGGMPQYHVGHLALVAQIDARVASLPRLALAGNAYRGVGIPDCILSGEHAAERLLQ